jgi:hypothetical protein
LHLAAAFYIQSSKTSMVPCAIAESVYANLR